MLLTPRYGPRAIIDLDGDPAAIAEPCIAQRRRFLEMIQNLDRDEWTRPSRCDGWSVRDVAVHLASTNTFWEVSVRSGVDGAPTELLARFDPVASPARMVADSTLSAAEVIETFAASSEALADVLLGLSETEWTMLAEAPPGHVSISAVMHHALWDSWVHERDIAVPLGRTPPMEPDEVIACLRYVAALTPALAIASGATGRIGFDVSVSEPHVDFHVEVADEVTVTSGTAGCELELAGRAVDLLEALSFRRPLEQVIPQRYDWALAGLATAFDR